MAAPIFLISTAEGLKELWDQYQTMLKLCTPPPAEQNHEDSAAVTLKQIKATQQAHKRMLAMELEAEAEGLKAGDIDMLNMPLQMPPAKSRYLTVEEVKTLFNEKKI